MRHSLTYERLIIAVDEVAPELSNTAYKLLWRLIANAIHKGRPDVDASVRQLAIRLQLSKDAVATAIRELAQYIRVEARDGEGTTFFLPADWFPPQRTLFSSDELGGDFHNRPNSQDGSVLFSRTPASQNPGHQRPGNQDDCAKNQDTSVLETRTIVPISRTQRANFQDASHDGAREDTRARVRSIESEASASSKVVDLIDRAWATVEIPVGSEADAALLSEWLYAYKCDLGPLAEHSAYTDTAMLARILDLAPLEQIQQVLRSLREQGKPCGDQDAWFFTVLAQRIHHVSPHLTRSRMAAQKSKALAKNGNPSLFQDEIRKATTAQSRRLA